MSMEVVYRSLKELVPYARNTKRHPAGQIAQLKASLLEFGWTRPIALADGMIIYGHGIFEAAQQLADLNASVPNHDDVNTAPTIDLSHLNKAQRKAYIIADNKLVEKGTWDRELLQLEFQELTDWNFDLQLTGFNGEEILGLLQEPQGGPPPNDFQSYDEDIETEHECPKCGYVWSGGKGAAKPALDE